jgi:ABC-2 type transport system ATP-binding protein
MTAAIEVMNIGRDFAEPGGRRTVLDEVAFTVDEGQVVGLLGENGAGKTTLTKILATLLLPSRGSARICGADIVSQAHDVRRCQSVVLGGDRGLYGRISAKENLRYFGMIAGVPQRTLRSRLGPALEEVGLAQAAERKVETFSKGMRQRLHIAIGMISEPRVLLLDEPTVGLDPIEAARLRRSIRDLAERGVTVLLTSHYLLDIEELAHRVVVLEHGTITRDLPVSEFSASLGYAAVVAVRGRDRVPDREALDALNGSVTAIPEEPAAWQAMLRLPDWSPDTFARLSRVLDGSAITGVEVRPARLEEAFMSLFSKAEPQ